MTDHNDAPAEHLPEGAIPTPSGEDETKPAPETMIGQEKAPGVLGRAMARAAEEPDDTPPPLPPGGETVEGEVTIDPKEVQRTLGVIEDGVRDPNVGDPLPVGAHDPENTPLLDGPPGMPKAPDEGDEVIARLADAIYNDDTETYGPTQSPSQVVRPDQATLLDAHRERILDGPRPRSVRETLLLTVQRARAEEREATMAWSRAVREQQEARLVVEDARRRREDAMDALGSLGLLTDDEQRTDLDAYPRAKPRKPVDDFVIH